MIWAKLLFSFLLCFVFFIGVAYSQKAERTKITFASDEWCPYNCDPKAKDQGYVVEILKAIFEDQFNYKIEYKIMPFSRALDYVEQGKIHGVIGTSIREGGDWKDDPNPKKVVNNPKEEFAQQRAHFFVKKDNPWRFDMKIPYDSLSKLKGKILLIQDYGHEQLDHIKKLKKELRVGGDRPQESMIEMLKNNRCETITEDPYVLQYVLERMKIQGKINKEFKMVDAGAAGSAYALYVGMCMQDKCKNLPALFDKGMRVIRKNGRLGQILAKYNIKDWK